MRCANVGSNADKTNFLALPDTFYSWLGGVLPEYRRQGVATQLMQHQHDWFENAVARMVCTFREGSSEALQAA
ncbi:MAG: GNAT family N-acetyltransferase [Lewinellaceae bacterium]|nr:GNAT family N-acetyltransferase [Lewinellaceae bacterium]